MQNGARVGLVVHQYRFGSADLFEAGEIPEIRKVPALPRFDRVHPAIISVQKDTLAIFFVLQGETISLGMDPCELLDKIAFVQLKEFRQALNFLLGNPNLAGPAAAGGATVALIKNRHAGKLPQGIAPATVVSSIDFRFVAGILSPMAERAERQPRGCFFYGLLTVILVFIGILVGVYFGTRKAVQYAVEIYTTNAPAQIPTLQISPAEEQRIAESLQKEAANALRGKTPQELILGENELNVLIGHSPDLAPYRKQIYLRPEGDQLRAYLSIPLDQFAPWKEFASRFRSKGWVGRYLNGMAVLDVSLTNSVLRVAPKKIIVSATTLPEDFVARFPWDNLTQRANEDPEVRAVLARIETIRVENGKARIRLRAL